ncbi:MAG TPA: sigma-70 family RNA polymerase sigma factor [Polyangia bacterium]|nr:sigma-70 family RNA polymerase sigma factor [Polyangia bacterium]
MSDNQQLVAEHLSFVKSIAARIKEQLPREIELDDLIAYGIQGLLEAAERYDGRHGTAFTTFAYYRVRGAIFDGLRGMGWLPRGEYARARFEERAAAYLANLATRDVGGAYARENPDAALEDEMRDLAEALGGVATVFITALTLKHDESLLDESPQPHERLERREIERRIGQVLQTMPAKERRLIEMYYFEDKTLEEAGATLGLSKSWSSRLHARAIDLLRKELERLSPAVWEEEAEPALSVALASRMRRSGHHR